MPKGKKNKATSYEIATDQFWREQRGLLTSQGFYLDTCAILGYFVRSDDIFRPFIDGEAVGRLYTSAFVVAEAARRLTKPRNRDPFRGPANEKDIRLALHVVHNWLSSKGISVLHVPQEVFDEAKVTFDKFKYVDGWDMTDAISYVIVRGMGQNRIISGDNGFVHAGLMLLPSDAWKRYSACTWKE